MTKPNRNLGLQTTTEARWTRGPMNPILVTGVLISLVFVSAHRVAAETDASAALTVLVFNFRHVPRETMVKAEAIADGIFQQAGVHIAWRDCPTGDEPCRLGPGHVFYLAVMSAPVKSENFDTVAGRAFLDNHAASIYYDRLPRIPGGRASASDTATVLGCVIAHELGHLLLGSHGHTVDGIMKGQWDTGQTELALRLQLRFLQQEAERMRAVLRKEVARIETVAASHAPQP